MTAGPEPAPRYNAVPIITAAPGSRLEQLQASYEAAKAAAEEANHRFEAVAKAIKAELAQAAPGSADQVVLSGAPGLPRLKMTWMRPYRFDSKQFRADHPELYVRYETRGGHWELRQEG